MYIVLRCDKLKRVCVHYSSKYEKLYQVLSTVYLYGSCTKYSYYEYTYLVQY